MAATVIRASGYQLADIPVSGGVFLNLAAFLYRRWGSMRDPLESSFGPVRSRDLKNPIP